MKYPGNGLRFVDLLIVALGVVISKWGREGGYEPLLSQYVLTASKNISAAQSRYLA